MGNYEVLKQAVSDVIKTNGNQEITGAIMQSALLTIISTVGDNATFAGIATPTTNPGTPDQNVFWLAAQPGIYNNFNAIQIENEVCILINKDGIWQKKDTGIANILSVSVLGYPIYLEDTTVDARAGHTSKKGTTPAWDCIVIPTKGAKRAYIEGIDINVPGYVCFWEEMPLFENSVTGGFISNIVTNVVNEGFVFDIPDNAKVLGFSLARASRLTEEKRAKIRIRDSYIDERIKPLSDEIEEVKKKTVSINSNLGFVANFDLSKYDDLLLIMDGQSLSIGWESIAISIESHENCYMLGTDPCTLYNSGNNSNGYNGIGLNPLKAVTRESPNVSWCNVLSKLIPNKRLITESVGEGAKKISQLSKTENTEIYTAEFLGNGVICDPTNGVITIGENTWKTWLLQVEEGQKYYIAGGTQAVTEFSQRPNIGANPNIYLGNANINITNKEYLCPQGVTYIAMTINNSEYIGEKMFVIKGGANRYERGFLLPLYQTANLSDINQKEMGCPAIAWMQGESDADGGTTKEEYKEMLVKLKNDMINDIKNALNQEENVLFFCYILAMAYNKDNQIAQAIIECCEENDDMILIAPIYPMPDYNNLHLSSNGYRWFGEYIARTTYNSIVLGKRNNSMIVNQITKKGNEVKISIDVPQLPIVKDTWTVQEIPDLGFTVWKDNVKCTISNIDIFSDVITITTIENIDDGVIEVSYAGYNTDNVSLYRGAGNIRDSERWQAMQYYWDDTDDKGTDGTSTITYRPKTKGGETIINKKYPMQNWLQNFYFKFE